MLFARGKLTKVLFAAITFSGLCCIPVSPPVSVEGVTDVRIVNIAFDPLEVTIAVGESVRWINLERISHTSTSGMPGDDDAGKLWESGTMELGEEFTRRFDEVGEFDYFCLFHPNFTAMRGRVIVVEASSP